MSDKLKRFLDHVDEPTADEGKPKRVRLTFDVDIVEPQTLKKHVRANMTRWGFGTEESQSQLLQDDAQMVFQILLDPEMAGNPQMVGLDIAHAYVE
jgi:hypothetical protein